MNDVRWELVHAFEEDLQVDLLASGWSPEGLALYISVRTIAHLDDIGTVDISPPAVQRSEDNGQTWAALPIPEN